VQLLTKKEVMRKTILAISVFAALLSFFGILQHATSNNKIFWLRELTQGGSPFGPYVNRNHYAGLMGMIFPLLVSLFLYYKPEVKYGSLRERIVEVFNHKRTDIHILLGLAAILVAVSIFLSLSRSGITSLSLSMIVLGGMFVRKGNKKRGVLIILFMIMLYAVGWFGWKPIFERFESVRNVGGDISDLRPGIWKDSVSVIKDFPLTGTGFGSYVKIYPRYRSISSEGILEHAHNDYLELFTDGGLIAALLFGWFLMTVFLKSFRVFLRRHEKYSIYVFIGVITGMVSILIHGITDFNFHIGANALYFFFLAGMVVSAAHTRLHGEHDTLLNKIKCPSMKQLSILPMSVFLTSLIFNIGILAGGIYFQETRNVGQDSSVAQKDLSLIKENLSRASLLDPLEARYQYYLAHAAWLSSRRDDALNHYLKAVRLDPVNGEYLQSMGAAMANLNKNDMADKLMQTGIACDISNPATYKRYGLWLLTRGKKEEGLKNLGTAIFLEPKKTREYITLLVLEGLSDEEVRSALPERAEPHLLFADYLQTSENDAMAGEEYRKALHLIKGEKEIKPSFFYRISGYYIKKGMYDDAILVMRTAEELLTDNVGLILGAADAYERAGITYRAVEEYRKALIADPKNEKARKKLELLQ
jgi:O-antigen ligase/Tfp pilus assembly protein PilF